MNKSKWAKCEYCEVKIWKESLIEFTKQQTSSILKGIDNQIILTKLEKCEKCEMNKLMVIIRDNKKIIKEYLEKGIYVGKELNDYMYLLNEGGLGVILKNKKGKIYIFEEYYIDGFSQAITYYGVRFWINNGLEYIKEEDWITSKKNIIKYKELLWKTGEIYDIIKGLSEKDNPFK